MGPALEGLSHALRVVGLEVREVRLRLHPDAQRLELAIRPAGVVVAALEQDLANVGARFPVGEPPPSLGEIVSERCALTSVTWPVSSGGTMP